MKEFALQHTILVNWLAIFVIILTKIMSVRMSQYDPPINEKIAALIIILVTMIAGKITRDAEEILACVLWGLFFTGFGSYMGIKFWPMKWRLT